MMLMTPPKPNDGFEWTQAAFGPVLRCRPLLETAPHMFTTAAVQLRDDEREWAAVAAEMRVDPASVRLIRQVHGRAVAVLRAGEGEPALADRPEADIIISDDSSVAIAVRVADCAPILLADRTRGAVGAAHAGWRGAMQGVAATAVVAMRETFGAEPANLIAAVGPSLGPCCGEMGPEVVEEFRAAGHPAADLDRWFRPGPRGRPHFDLWAVNRDQLERAGVPAGSIHVAGVCSRCRPDVFHSYRAAGASAGRMIGVIRRSPTARS
jgi:YfiH family protein